MRLFGAMFVWTVFLVSCQAAAPTSPTPPSGPVSTAQNGSESTPALGIDLRLPPTRAPRPTPTAAGPQSPVASPSPSASVTLSDQDRTLMLQVNQRVLVNLGEEFDWSVQIDDPSIVSRLPNITVARGAQGVYEAHRVGQTVLSATGDPVCRRAQPACAAPSRSFRVQIVVQ
jgi:hypothetical protein